MSWWADLNLYDPVAAARRLSMPALILHGGRDYQVTDEDFALFQAGHVDAAVVEAVAGCALSL